MWTLYGLVATHDILLWLPNGLGIILAVTQLIVKGIFSPLDLRCTSLFGSLFGSSHTTGTSTSLKRPLTPSGARRGAALIHIHDDDLNGTGVGGSGGDIRGGDVYGIHMLVQHSNSSSSHKLVEQGGGGQASPTDYTPCP